MTQPVPPTSPLLEPKPGERTLGLILVAGINGVLGALGLSGLVFGASIPPEMAALPPWFLTFAKCDLAVVFASAIGLWMLKRWGFGLMVLGYFSSIIVLVILRQSFVCQAMFQFPLLAIAGKNWKALR